jgi:hypothetical protein
LGWLLAIASFIIRYFGQYARESNLGTIATTPSGHVRYGAFFHLEIHIQTAPPKLSVLITPLSNSPVPSSDTLCHLITAIWDFHRGLRTPRSNLPATLAAPNCLPLAAVAPAFGPLGCWTTRSARPASTMACPCSCVISMRVFDASLRPMYVRAFAHCRVEFSEQR